MTHPAAEPPTPRPAPTSGMTPERWEAVKAVVQAALARPAAARPAFVADACGADAALRAEVDALLAMPDTGEGADLRLERPGVAGAIVGAAPAAGITAGTMAEAAAGTAAGRLPTLSRYRVLERLGSGGMGVVYRARDERLARDVALKFLPPHLGADEAAKGRFLIEARAAAALEHPNICTIHEIGDTEDGTLYIAMACYDGETLDRRIARGPLPVGEALRVAGEIARGLGKAHERGIVHRDIKPANVMVTTDGLVKILDFGIAKLVDAGAMGTLGAVGTIAYMSPEQAFGETVDHRADLWSLGVVLYEMLTGVRPFRGSGQQAVLVAALTADPEPVTRLRRDAPVEVDAVLRRALAKAPGERFASAAEMHAALAASARLDAAAPSLGDTMARREDEPRDTALTRGGERRPVAVVACAVAGFDALIERLTPEEVDAVRARSRAAAAEVAERHGGTVSHCADDGLVMLFGVPAAHEDDAVRGVRAALALHARVADLAATLDARLSAALRLRTGVHVGLVVAQRLREGDRRFRISGPAADVAGRLAAAAEPDAILVSPAAHRLVAAFVYTTEAPPVALQADRAPAVPHRVLGASDVRSRLAGAARVRLSPFVGRERERAALAEHLGSAGSGSGRVTVLVGEAGAGKSRLLHELAATAAAAGTRVLVGHCDTHGGTTPFLPFVEAAEEALGLARDGAATERHDAAVAAVRAVDASLEEFLPLLLALLAIPSETHPVPEHLRGERFQAAMLEAIAALFTLAARAAPTLLLLEDWHWADDGSRAALRQLAEIVPAFALLVVVTSRPDGTAAWGGADHHALLHLPPLDGLASAAIARAVLGATRVAPELVAHLHERTGGNPFFLEELCEALREEGAVTVRDGEAAAASRALRVPATVQGVLRTRIDRLDGEGRDALRVASVIGREFTRGLLEDVLAPGGDLPRALERLKASGLVQQVGVVPEPAYRFKHALTQEVAYESLLEHQRATLHAAVGRAIEHRYAGRIEEHVERLAHHFGRAEAWTEAVRYGRQAADRAAALGQSAEALGTLERVAEWVQRLPEDAARRDLHADVLLRQERLCEMLGLRDRQLSLVEALIALLAPHGPSERLAQVHLREGDVFTLLHRFEAAEQALGTALRIAVERGDAAGERNTLRSIALLRSYEERHEEALATVERVLMLDRAAGDAPAEAGDLATHLNILRAMGEPERARAVLEHASALSGAADAGMPNAALLYVIATVYVDLGDHETALAYYRQSLTRGVTLRDTVNPLVTLPAIAHLELQQGHVEQALATFRQAVEMSRRARHADGAAYACRSLGEALVGLGRDEEALPSLRDAASLFAQVQDGANEALMWRRLAAAHERLGRHDDAHAAWTRARDLHRAALHGAGEAEAVEGMARAERRMRAGAETVVARYEEALGLAERLGDRARELAVRNALGIVHWERGAYADALAHYEVALRLCREENDRVHEGLLLSSLGVTLHRLHRCDEARAALAEGACVARAAGERRIEAQALAALGEVCLAVGQLDEAAARVEASLALRRELADRRGEGWMLERLARIAAARGAPEAARAAARAASAIAYEIGDEALQAAIARLQPVASTDSPNP